MMNKKEPVYERFMAVGLVLTVIIFAGVSYYWYGESSRLVEASESFTDERVQRGGEIYNDQCTACHGVDGEGGSGTALNDRDLLKNTLDDIFFSVIRSGVPSTEMPAWSVDYGGPLTDEDIRDVVAFIRAWEPTAPEVEAAAYVPDASRGALLFATTCTVCHGENGSGTEQAPAINDPERLAALDNDWYRATINNGRPAKGMPTWGTVLSPNQTEDLIALIDAWRQGTQVEAEFSFYDLIDSAIFSLEENDNSSAELHISRAIAISQGAEAEILRNAIMLMDREDTEGAIATLRALKIIGPINVSVKGSELYAAQCAACHGVQGEGGVGTPLQPNAFVQDASNPDLIAFLLEGRPGTAMAGFEGRLSESELSAIISFLREWQP